MNKLKIIITAIILLTLLGCGKDKTPLTQPTPPVTPTNTPKSDNLSPDSSQNLPSSPASINIPPVENSSLSQSATGTNSQLISATGIGTAKVGMTLGQLKQILKGKAEFQVQSPFMVDFDAIAIIQAGKTQYYILYPAGSPMRDIDIIEALVTDNPNYQTAEGVGPGTSIAKAEDVYGDATLSYNQSNESREYVKFLKQPSPDIAFRLGAGNDGSLAGIYSSPTPEFNQTKEFKKTATIRLVEVYCRSNCPPPPLPFSDTPVNNQPPGNNDKLPVINDQ